MCAYIKANVSIYEEDAEEKIGHHARPLNK